MLEVEVWISSLAKGVVTSWSPLAKVIDLLSYVLSPYLGPGAATMHWGCRPWRTCLEMTEMSTSAVEASYFSDNLRSQQQSCVMAIYHVMKESEHPHGTTTWWEQIDTPTWTRTLWPCEWTRTCQCSPNEINELRKENSLAPRTHDMLSYPILT